MCIIMYMLSKFVDVNIVHMCGHYILS